MCFVPMADQTSFVGLSCQGHPFLQPPSRRLAAHACQASQAAAPAPVDLADELAEAQVELQQLHKEREAQQQATTRMLGERLGLEQSLAAAATELADLHSRKCCIASSLLNGSLNENRASSKTGICNDIADEEYSTVRMHVITVC